MIYQIGDKFLVNGMLTEVIYTNAGKAWVGPVEDEGPEYKGVAISVLDEEGRDKQGKRALPVVNENSMAV